MSNEPQNSDVENDEIVVPIQPFFINVTAAEVQRLHQKLADTRIPNQSIVPGAGHDYGIPLDWAKGLFNYWIDEFSWPSAFKRINRYPHFEALIKGVRIHFVHEKSASPNAIPLLMVHGWPGTFYEDYKVIGPLSSPPEGSDHPAFHVVAPSLLGFCWSQNPPRQWPIEDTAWMFHELMMALEYEQYCVHAGDWGQFVARHLGAQFSHHCRVIHLNVCPAPVPEDWTLTPREAKVYSRGKDWRANHLGYAVMMRTRPQSVGWMLTDNPVGLMTFIGEKYHEAANPVVWNSTAWKDHILTTVCLYYFSNCIMTSCLLYTENVHHEKFGEYCMRPENRIRCPFGYTSMGWDTAPNFERAAAQTGNLVFYRERDYAGHFACLEDPNGMVEDIRAVVAAN